MAGFHFLKQMIFIFRHFFEKLNLSVRKSMIFAYFSENVTL